MTSSSEDKTAAHSLSAEVQSLKETVETLHEAREKTETEHRSQLEAVQQELSQAKERDEALQHQLKGKVRTTVCEIIKVYCNPLPSLSLLHCRRRSCRHW